MSVEIVSRYVRMGTVCKVCPFILSFNKSKSSWNLEKLKPVPKCYTTVNSLGFFFLFLSSNVLLVQMGKDIRRPLDLGFELSGCIVSTFAAYSQLLMFSDSGVVEFINGFFKLITIARKWEYFYNWLNR